MTIKSVTPTNFRNLASREINLGEGFNLFVGKNGSGKTSLLEALYMLASGRSFRTTKLESIIFRSQESSPPETYLFGELECCDFNNGASTTTHSIGIRKSKVDKALIKIDGQNISAASALAALCPVSVIEPDNLSLLSGAPQGRRKFIDWGVFHVEPEFSVLWKNYLHALKQRNAYLRSTPSLSANSVSQLRVWDEQLCAYASHIDRVRLSFIDRLKRIFVRLLSELLPGIGVTLIYRRGWDKESELSTALKKNSDTDLSRGFTSVGPHRMDVRIQTLNKAAVEVLSRGQLKLVTVALYLAQVEALHELTRKNTVVMVDDICAELDAANVCKVFSILDDVNSQIICTTLDVDGTRKSIKTTRDIRVFHVEHGQTKEDKTSISDV